MISFSKVFGPPYTNISNQTNTFQMKLVTCEVVMQYEYVLEKNIKLQPVPPSMPSEALSVLFWDTHSASSGIDGGTGCNFVFFYTRVHTIEAY